MLSVILSLTIISVLLLIKNKKDYSAITFGIATILMFVFTVNGLGTSLEMNSLGNKDLKELNRLILFYSHELSEDLSDKQRQDVLLNLHELTYQYNKKEKELLKGL